VASTAIPLLTGSGFERMVEVGDVTAVDDPQARGNFVSPRLFATTGVPLLAGRDFTDTDTEASPQVAIVNESFVRKFNLGAGAIGQRFRVFGEDVDREIVGIVADAADSGGGVKSPVYAPRDRERPEDFFTTLAPTFRKTVREFCVSRCGTVLDRP
jgi:hypothetical protein